MFKIYLKIKKIFVHYIQLVKKDALHYIFIIIDIFYKKYNLTDFFHTKFV
jgi:hypothetical protein